MIGGIRSLFGQRAAAYQRAAASAEMQRQQIAGFHADGSGLTGEQWLTLRGELDELAASASSRLLEEESL